ncbi:beta-galactosidase [Streptomyces sp. PpalLS-921]|nr:beta-galactosidase [Streptomyces sp. PpalLS-921]
MWSDVVVPRGAETLWSYADGLPAGRPAITRNQLGEGTAWYVSTRLSGPDLDTVLGRALADAGVTPRTGLAHDVEVVRRAGETGTYLFAINHTDAAADVELDAPGTELLTGQGVVEKLTVPAGAVRVVRLDG